MDDENVWFTALLIGGGIGLLTDSFGAGIACVGGVMLLVWLVQKNNGE